MSKEPSTVFGELDAIMNVSRRTRCLFATQIESFSEEDKAALAHAIANPRYSNKAILQVCLARGAKFSKWAVAHHRNKECCCEFGG